jgi:hypothetical protein
MSDPKLEVFRKIIVDADSIQTSTSAYQYLSRVRGFISTAFSEEILSHYDKFLPSSGDVYERVGSAIGFLEGLYERTFTKLSETNINSKGSVHPNKFDLKNVFIVHGRDGEAKEIVARFIQKIGLNPIILHEQPNSEKR